MRQFKWMAVLAVVVGALATPALAYDRPTGTIYAGYSILNDTELEETFTKGFVADVTLNVGETFAIPLEFSWHSKTFEEEILGLDLGAELTYMSYMGGLRLGGGIYTQILAGGATVDGELLGIDADSSTKFAIQPGIGFDLPLTEKLSVRLGGDYRIIFIGEDGDENVKQWRAHAGLVLGFGGYY